MEIIVVANPKGGVGKTTFSVNMSAVSAAMGKKTLLIDLDPNLSSTLMLKARDGMLEGDDQSDVSALFSKSPKKISELATPLSKFEFDMVLGSYSSVEADHFLDTQTMGELYLFDLIEDDERLKRYDTIIIDTGGRIGNIMNTAIMAADRVIAPAESSQMAFEQVEELIPLVEKLNKFKMRLTSGQSGVKLSHVVMTKFRKNTIASNEIKNRLVNLLSGTDTQLAATPIPLAAEVENSNLAHMPVVMFSPEAEVSIAFYEVYEEVLG